MKKKRVENSAVDVLDKISLSAKGLRSRLDAIVDEAGKQISNHQRNVAWYKTDLVKLYEDLVEHVGTLGTTVEKLRG